MSTLSEQVQKIESKSPSLSTRPGDLQSLSVGPNQAAGELYICHIGMIHSKTKVSSYRVKASASNVKMINRMIASIQDFTYRTVIREDGTIQMFYRYPEEP